MPRGRPDRRDLAGRITRRPLLPRFVERPPHPGRHGEPLASGKPLDLRQFLLREEHLEPFTHALSIAGVVNESTGDGGLPRCFRRQSPIAGAAVLFSPVAGGVPGRATTAEDGSFTLSTFDVGDGAMVGLHRVGISKMDVTGFVATADGLSGKLDGRQIEMRSVVPERYMNPATSGFEATVERGAANRFEFALTSE